MKETRSILKGTGLRFLCKREKNSIKPPPSVELDITGMTVDFGEKRYSREEVGTRQPIPKGLRSEM